MNTRKQFLNRLVSILAAMVMTVCLLPAGAFGYTSTDVSATGTLTSAMPKTGDMLLLGAVILLIVAIIALILALRSRRRKDDHRDDEPKSRHSK